MARAILPPIMTPIWAASATVASAGVVRMRAFGKTQPRQDAYRGRRRDHAGTGGQANPSTDDNENGHARFLTRRGLKDSTQLTTGPSTPCIGA